MHQIEPKLLLEVRFLCCRIHMDHTRGECKILTTPTKLTNLNFLNWIPLSHDLDIPSVWLDIKLSKKKE